MQRARVGAQGRFCLYKVTDEDEEDCDEAADGGICKVSRGIPLNSPVQVLIRVYVVSVRARSPSSQKPFQDRAEVLFRLI